MRMSIGLGVKVKNGVVCGDDKWEGIWLNIPTCLIIPISIEFINTWSEWSSAHLNEGAVIVGGTINIPDAAVKRPKMNEDDLSVLLMPLFVFLKLATWIMPTLIYDAFIFCIVIDVNYY